MWRKIILAVLLFLAPIASLLVVPTMPVLAATTADIVVTATPEFGGVGASGNPLDNAKAIVLLGLAFMSVSLTVTMFITHNMMLGFVCAMFWAILGGRFYELSTVTWDIYYLLFFASAFGMVIFTILAAYGLREKRDTLADEEMEKGEGSYIDEEEI